MLQPGVWGTSSLSTDKQASAGNKTYHLPARARWDDQRGAYGFVHVPTGHFMPRAIASGLASNEFGHNLFQAGVPADGRYMHCYRSVVCGASPDQTNWLVNLMQGLKSRSYERSAAALDLANVVQIDVSKVEKRRSWSSCTNSRHGLVTCEVVACSLWWSPICAGFSRGWRSWRFALVQWVVEQTVLFVLVRKQAMWHSVKGKYQVLISYCVLQQKRYGWMFIRLFVQFFLSKELGALWPKRKTKNKQLTTKPECVAAGPWCQPCQRLLG